MEKLENELNAYWTNLIKESIRMGYNDFGDFYYAHGALGDAFKNYVRTRDYCTTSKHIIHMCLNAILVSIGMGQFTHVSSYIGKAEQNPDALEPITVVKLRAPAGLGLSEAKKYKLVARKIRLMDKVNAAADSLPGNQTTPSPSSPASLVPMNLALLYIFLAFAIAHQVAHHQPRQSRQGHGPDPPDIRAGRRARSRLMPSLTSSGGRHSASSTPPHSSLAPRLSPPSTLIPSNSQDSLRLPKKATT